MRREDREIKDKEEIIRVMRDCDVCRIALNDDGYPYIIPLNFGLSCENDEIILYFHSALEGHKLDLIRKDPRAAFEMDCRHTLQYFEEKGYCTMAYESVAGKGEIEILSDEEKEAALVKLMEQYHPMGKTYFNPAAMERTVVYCLHVKEIYGKRKKKK